MPLSSFESTVLARGSLARCECDGTAKLSVSNQMRLTSALPPPRHDQRDAFCIARLSPARRTMIDPDRAPEILRVMECREKYPSGRVHIEAWIIAEPGFDLRIASADQPSDARNPPAVHLHRPQIDRAILIFHFRTNPSPLLPPPGPQCLLQPRSPSRRLMDALTYAVL